MSMTGPHYRKCCALGTGNFQTFPGNSKVQPCLRTVLAGVMCISVVWAGAGIICHFKSTGFPGTDRAPVQNRSWVRVSGCDGHPLSGRPGPSYPSACRRGCSWG